MAWLLDTNAWIHYLKNPGSRIRTELERQTPDGIVVCAVVKAELLHGAQKYGMPDRRTVIVQETLAPYRSLAFDDAAAEHYARIRPNWKNRASASVRTTCSSPPSVSRTIALWSPAMWLNFKECAGWASKIGMPSDALSPCDSTPA